MARNRLATSLDFETDQRRAACHLQTWGPALTSAPSLPTVKCCLSVAVLRNTSPPCHILKQGRRKQLKSGGPEVLLQRRHFLLLSAAFLWPSCETLHHRATF